MMLLLDELSTAQKQLWLQYAIAPRPVALVSTISKSGQPNLSPFSFFNLFSSEPPIVIFSPSRRVRNNTQKHTLLNIEETGEAVIHIVTEDLVQQTSLASCEYPDDVDEFIKAGFTKEHATMVKPFMVKESPVKLECKILEIKPLGTNGGAGNLVIAEVLCIHVDEKVLNADQTMIDPLLILQVGRLGGNWYSSVNKESMFEVEKPNIQLGIGFDSLPKEIINSPFLTRNHVAQLASVASIPEVNQTGVAVSIQDEAFQHAAKLLDENKVPEAWQWLLSN